MEISILLTEEILSLVLIGIAGYVLRRWNVISHEGSKGLTAACIYVCVPCALFHSVQVDFTPERVAGFWYAVITALVIHGIFFVIGGILRKPLHLKDIEYACVIYSNVGSLILPIVLGVFGNEYLLYVGIYVAIQNAFMWSHGQMTLCGTVEGALKKTLMHPCVVAIILGFLFVLTGLELPPLIDKTCTALRGCVAPLPMMTVGILIAEIDFKGIFKQMRIYLVIALRQLISPLFGILAAYLIWKYFPVRLDPVIYIVTMMGGCAPTAAGLVQMAQLYDNDPGYASSINILSTLFSIVTIPIMVSVAQLLVR